MIVPYDRPLLPPQMYTLETFPAFVDLTNAQLLPGADRIINAVIVQLANTSSMTCSQSYVRMIAYNTLSDQNWSNGIFRDAVLFVSNYIIMLGNGGMMPQGMEPLINQAYQLISSAVVAQNQTMLSMMDQSTQGKIMRNVQTYRELFAKITAMLSSSVMQHSGMGGGMGGGMMHGMGQSIGGVGHPSLSGAGTGQTQATRFGPVNTSTMTLAQAQAQAQAQMAQAKPATPPPAAQPTVTQAAATVITDDIFSKDTEMDREQHEIIYRANIADKEEVMKAISNQAAKAETEESLTSVHEIDTLACYSTSIALQTIVSEFLDNVNESVEVYHGLIEHYIPIFCTEDLDPLFSALATANTLDRAAEIMKNYLTDACRDPKSRGPRAAALQIDKLITDMVNVKLKEYSPQRTLEIDSFVEDIGDIPDYLRKKYGVRAHNDWVDYQSTLLSSVFQRTRADIDEPSYIKTPPPHYALIGERVGVSFITAAMTDLNLQVARKASTIVISKANTPSLHKLINDANQIAKRNNVTRHIFMTLDNSRFNVESPEYDRDTLVLSQVKY